MERAFNPEDDESLRSEPVRSVRFRFTVWQSTHPETTEAPEGDDDEVVSKGNRRGAARIELEEDDNRQFIIPAQDDDRVRTLAQGKRVIAMFLRQHYGKGITDTQETTGTYIAAPVTCSGRPAAKVPWKDIAERQSTFVDPKYLPAKATLRDPEKLVAAEVDVLLGHWRKRQQRPSEGPAFLFRRYKKPDGELGLPDATYSKMKGSNGKGKGKALPPPRPEKVASGSGSKGKAKVKSKETIDDSEDSAVESQADDAEAVEDEAEKSQDEENSEPEPEKRGRKKAGKGTKVCNTAQCILRRLNVLTFSPGDPLQTTTTG